MQNGQSMQKNMNVAQLRARYERFINAMRLNVCQSILAVMPRRMTTRERVRCFGMIIKQHDPKGTSILDRNCSLQISVRGSSKLALHD